MRREERGQALVEFALVLPIMLLVIVGVIDVARAVFQENTLAYAAREGTRYMILHGSNSTSPITYCSSCSNSTVQSIVETAAIGVPNITVTISYPDGNTDRGSKAVVDVTAPFVPLPSQYLFGGGLTVTLRGGSSMVIEH